ncbi:hypothetical protein A8F94_09050 [Bacillus sp. FJAT-27225]|uniref:hypothetical protein n=1 Tax=Bacillus sp. FJAT-27225 TaxID=1743144 RepID=UPI00080C2BCC|nr:hypothetical protein [Bacillus sp. FJAT-27225]OCA87965.1 hypothetical protein A8F94_09050 [Bacillus sp. FJAT-27225]
MEKWKKILIGIGIVSIYVVIGTGYYESIASENTVLESFISIDYFVILWIGLILMGIPILAMLVICLFIIGKYVGLVYWVYWSMGSASLTKKCIVGLIIIGILLSGFILNNEWAGFIPGP